MNAASVEAAYKLGAAAGPTKLQNAVIRGRAPSDVVRVDKGHIPGQEPHVHYRDGTSSTASGKVHDAHAGWPNPSKKVREWLENNGWIPPMKKE